MYRRLTEVDGWTFRQLSVRPMNLSLTSVKFLCVRATVCQFSILPYSGIFLQLPSTLCPSARHFVNSPIVHATFHQLSSTFCLSMENILCGSWTFRLTSDNFLCVCVTFRQLSVCLRYHPSSFSASAGYSVNFLCVRRTFCKPT